MTPDKVGLAVKRDELILKFGLQVFNKHGHDEDKTEYINCKMRELGRLVIQLRTENIK